MNNWIEQLLPIIAEYKNGSDEPLDDDSVDRLCHIIKAKINLHEGNITEAVYESILDFDTHEVLDKASYYLSHVPDNLIVLLKDAMAKDPTMLLEEIEDIIVWEPLEGKYNVSQFCELINL